MSDAEKIWELMKARHLSQNAFAKKTGVAQSYISYILNGKQRLTNNIASKICNALEIDISYFQEEPKEEIKEELQEEETVLCSLKKKIKKLFLLKMQHHTEIS